MYTYESTFDKTLFTPQSRSGHTRARNKLWITTLTHSVCVPVTAINPVRLYNTDNIVHFVYDFGLYARTESAHGYRYRIVIREYKWIEPSSDEI